MRIISMLPSATEIAAALGLRDQLVGVSHECDFPADVSELPRLTASVLDHGLSPAEIDAAVKKAGIRKQPLYTVDGDRLAELQPDLIITQGVCTVCAVTPQTIGEAITFTQLDCALTTPVLSLSGVDFAGVLADIRAVGQAAGVPERAEALVASLQARWDALPGAAGDAAPRVLFLEWPDPPWTGGHWVPEQIEAAGGIALLGEAGHPSRRLTWAQVEAADPDVILGAACGYDLDTNARHFGTLVGDGPLGRLRAVREGRAWAVDANSFFSRPAPRLVDGAELLAALLRGDDVGPERARRL